jgi:ribosomal protein S18 acetylase RimI-like enzyme
LTTIIKKAETDDKEPISDLMTISMIEEYGEPPAENTMVDLLEYYFSRSDSNIYCLKEDDNFAGFVWLIDSADVITGISFCCILYIAVKKEFRGKKYSKLLIDKAKEHCKENNVQELRLTVRYNNDTALNLYKNKGFQTYKHEMLLKIV